MTSPAQQVTVQCPSCGNWFETFYRASFNLSIEEWSDEQIRDATTATCPACGNVAELDSLIVQFVDG